MVLPDNAIVATLLSVGSVKKDASGFQAVASPVIGFRAAMLFRNWPAILVKAPPTYKIVSESTIASTASLAAGLKVGSTVLSLRILAMFVRGSPPTEANCPPM